MTLMKPSISKWDSPLGSRAIISLVLGLITAFCWGWMAAYGIELATEKDIETIISDQFFGLIPWAIAFFVVSVFIPVVVLIEFFISAIYIFLCLQVVFLATHEGKFSELTDFALFLFALSLPGLLIGFSTMQLLLWHIKYPSQVYNRNHLLKTND